MSLSSTHGQGLTAFARATQQRFSSIGLKGVPRPKRQLGRAKGGSHNITHGQGLTAFARATH